MQQADVSVIVCAYTEQRWNDLKAAITALQHQTLPPSEIVLVIDHNPGLLELARTHFQNVVVVENREEKGLSGARNTGVAASHGSLIAFIDDDAVVEPDCLEWLTQPFSDPQVLGTGGNVEPTWAAARPGWFPEEFLWVVGCCYRGLPTSTSKIRNPIGACMCLRREVFKAIGGFQSGVGRIGTLPLGCEETELCIRASQHWPQGKFIYEPRAKVHHLVPASRGQLGYFLRRCYAEGLSKAMISRLVGAGSSLSSESSYTLRTLPQGVIRGILDTFTHADLNGLLRSAAIIAGLMTTSVGYAVGTLSNFGSPPIDAKSADISG